MIAEYQDYPSFIAWAAEEPSRSVKITIDNDHISIIVGQWIKKDDATGREYVCQIVAAVSEIDLVGKLARQREEDRKVRRLEYERLEAEFGRGCTECPHDVTEVFHGELLHESKATFKYPNG